MGVALSSLEPESMFTCGTLNGNRGVAWTGGSWSKAVRINTKVGVASYFK